MLRHLSRAAFQDTAADLVGRCREYRVLDIDPEAGILYAEHLDGAQDTYFTAPGDVWRRFHPDEATPC